TDYWRAPWRELAFAWRAWRFFRSLESKEQLAGLAGGGILICDLVIGSYLRFKPTAEGDLDDLYLFVILRPAVKDVSTPYAYFRKARPCLYLTTYATYIQHGIPVRVAVALGIPVRSFANAQEFSTVLTKDHFFQTTRCGDYSERFARLPDGDEKIARADRI